jgi:hypothetical protein
MLNSAETVKSHFPTTLLANLVDQTAYAASYLGWLLFGLNLHIRESLIFSRWIFSSVFSRSASPSR